VNRSSDLSGIAAMLAATAVFVVGDSFMKLVTHDLPPFETLFLRSIAASIACAVLVTLRGEWRVISGVFNVRALLRAAGRRSAPSAMSWLLLVCRLPM
jgi:drug/metabolite transporter (DMT)-like permease